MINYGWSKALIGLGLLDGFFYKDNLTKDFALLKIGKLNLTFKFNILSNISLLDLRLKGGYPHNNKYVIAPKLHISHFSSYFPLILQLPHNMAYLKRCEFFYLLLTFY